MTQKWLSKRKNEKNRPLYMCPDEQKNAIFKDLNPHKHTQIMKTIFFLLQWGKLLIELGAKVHMDTFGMNRGL